MKKTTLIIAIFISAILFVSSCSKEAVEGPVFCDISKILISKEYADYKNAIVAVTEYQLSLVKNIPIEELKKLYVLGKLYEQTPELYEKLFANKINELIPSVKKEWLQAQQMIITQQSKKLEQICQQNNSINRNKDLLSKDVCNAINAILAFPDETNNIVVFDNLSACLSGCSQVRDAAINAANQRLSTTLAASSPYIFGAFIPLVAVIGREIEVQTAHNNYMTCTTDCGYNN